MSCMSQITIGAFTRKEKSMDIMSIAQKNGFRIHMRVGAQKTHCPKCHVQRSNQHDRSLSVRIDETGIGWRCHHCQWTGGELSNVKLATRKMVGQSQNRFGESNGYRRLQWAARTGWGAPRS